MARATLQLASAEMLERVSLRSLRSASDNLSWIYALFSEVYPPLYLSIFGIRYLPVSLNSVTADTTDADRRLRHRRRKTPAALSHSGVLDATPSTPVLTQLPPQSIVKILVHIVFSAKDRRPLIPDGLQPRFYFPSNTPVFSGSRCFQVRALSGRE